MVYLHKKFVYLLSLTLLLISGAVHSEADKTVLVVGDSLSAAYNIDNEAGWVNLIRQKLIADHSGWQVINASISGETTDGGLRRLPELLTKYQPEIVVIALGGNDGLRGFQPADIKQRLAEMIDLARTETDSQIVLLGIEIPPNYGDAYSRAFRQIFTDLADTKNTALLPFMLEGIYNQPGMMQSDGLHPTAKAQPLIADLVWPQLKPLLND